MDDIAVVIVNYNTRDDLDRCLASVLVSQGVRHRVVVVDNCSADGSAEMVAARYPGVELIRSDHNGGYAYANNIGLRAAGYGQGRDLSTLPRYVLLLNPDTVLPADALARVVALMGAQPESGVLGPKLVREDGSLDRACRRSFPTPAVSFYHLSGLGRLFPRSRRFAGYNLTYLDENQPAEVDAVVGAFMLLRAQALEEAGLLDEVFFMYGEDLDLCYRIKARGWRVRYEPSVVVLHRKGAASRKVSRRAIIAFYDAMKLFHDKHYRAQTPFLVNWAIDGGVALLRWVALAQDRLRPAGRRRVASA
ncbi:MAG: glycosyltransferase family 2 protein [Chloroflexota bacterium]